MADNEHLLRAVFLCFHGQKEMLIFFKLGSICGGLKIVFLGLAVLVLE